jgi:hypothetical protein
MEGLYPIIRRKRRPLGIAEVGVRNAESGGQMPEAGGEMPEEPVLPALVEPKRGKRRKGALGDVAA